MVRRTAEIFLFDPEDTECLWAKYGVNGFREEAHFKSHERIRQFAIDNDIDLPEWFDEMGVRQYDETVNVDYSTGQPNRENDGSLSPYNFSRPYYHRAMSNNSIAFTKKPERKLLSLVFELMQGTGEPGFANLEELRRRRPNAEGLNPCAEIALDSYGVCNLTTINWVSFVQSDGNGGYTLDVDGLVEAQRLSARAGLRMTLAELELPHWDAIQKRDRLLGPSMTGVMDALDLVGMTEEDAEPLLQRLRNVAREEADKYAKELRVASPLLTTTVKPEGTLSQVAGGVSSGLHRSHSPFYIRRIRINATDALAQVARELEWTINPENGTPGDTYEDKLANARTLVIDFPVKSGAKQTKDDVNAVQQLDTYFRFQKHYTEHNASNTITVKPDEWADVENKVWSNWDRFAAVSFLAHDGGTYQLPPYEAITEERYNELVASMKPFDPSLLQAYETMETDLDIGNDGCENGICPVR